VTSRSFPPNGTIPIDQTCDGKDVSPQLTWSAPPPGTQSLALEVSDPDTSKNFTHWLVFNIPPDVTQIAEGAELASVHGTIGVNDFPDTRYGGPCPPKGEVHRYVFQLYALNATLPLHEGAGRAAVDAAMAGHVLGFGKVTGTFGR
jgi:Raf kinase inhibitor-like YbhB/YbcL family protein